MTPEPDVTEPTTSTIFVSYKREDRARVAPLVEGLRTARLTVWWDADIPGGVNWRPTILEHLEASSCVIVVWSAGSVSEAGGFVHEEAARAKARGSLLPVRLDAVAPPLGFGEIQSLDLIGWSGRSDDPRVADIADAARALVQGGPRPRPRAVTLSQWTMGAFVASALAGLGFFADVASFQHTVCRAPGLRYACANLGLGGIPSPAEQAMWDARPLGDCEWLRGFLVRFPAGAHADEAGRRLQALRRTAEDTWRPETRPVPLFVGLPERPGFHRGRRASRCAVAWREGRRTGVRGVHRRVVSPSFRDRRHHLVGVALRASYRWCPMQLRRTRAVRGRCAADAQS